jgi:hypothetical protein
MSGGYVDLELRANSDLRLILWVEVKHGTQPYADQVKKYLQDIGAEPADRRRVQLLVPANTSLVDVDGVQTEYWETLGGWIRQWTQARRYSLRSYQIWLLGQFLEFLKEEGLEDLVGLRAIHVVTMARAADAAVAFQTLRNRVDRLLQQQFAVVETGQVDGGRRFFGHYRPRDMAVEETDILLNRGWLEWKFLDDRLLPVPRGEAVFGAGYTIHKRRAPSSEASITWRAELEREGFILGIDDMWRLYRFWYPDQLLQKQTLEDQAELMAGWISDAFRRILRDPVSG